MTTDAINPADAAARVGALAGRASAADFVTMATRLAEATSGTSASAVYRALAEQVPYQHGDMLWYETPEGFEIAKRMVLGDHHDDGPLH
ncbi:MAG: hypothetical protein M0003_07745 [Acidithiobacillus sp.]|nr:hypothetical protein [Acidithiobacillus sp.]